MVARFQLVNAVAAQPAAADRWPAEWAAALPEGLGWSFRRDLHDQHNPHSAMAPSTAWRLVGGNNRELGRSALPYPDVATCLAAVTFLREHLNEADTLLANTSTTGLWLWRLNIGDRWMAVAGRSYLRRRECQYNLAQFVAEAPTATFPSAISGRLEVHGRQRVALPLSPSSPSQISVSPIPT
jgi:hypothetical protein